MYASSYAAREVKDVRYAARAVRDVRFTAFCIVCNVVALPDFGFARGRASGVRFVYPTLAVLGAKLGVHDSFHIKPRTHIFLHQYTLWAVRV